MRLDGKTAVITGAGRGIGRAIAIRFAVEGARVLVNDIDPEVAEAVVEQIKKNTGIAVAVQGDVSDQRAVERMMAQARAMFGPIDILVNNAGGATIAGDLQRFSECTREFIDKIIYVNLMSTLFCTRSVAREMKDRRTGRIINISSIRGMVGDQNNVLYGTAKGAVLAFTQSLAMEMGEYGVTVNSISPGAIASRPGPSAMKNYIGRPGTCEEVAALALFLASEEADFITGENIVIDGGRIRGARGD